MDTNSISPDTVHELEHIGNYVGGVFKEVVRRVELRRRLETEVGRRLSDGEFLVIAEQTRIKI